MGFTVRPSVRADFEALGVEVPTRLKSYTAVGEDGEILGAGGLAYLGNGAVMAFTELTEQAKKTPVALHKAALGVIREAQESGVRELVAYADMARSAAAERWLERLGFIQERRGGALIWVWKSDGV
jgi:hypothetical protein